MASACVRLPKVILFGDSLVERSFDIKDGLWGAILASKLTRIADVVVRGFSGYNTRMCKVILPSLFSTADVADVETFLICLGANDSSEPQSPTRQHVPLNEYHDNLVVMIEYLEKIGLPKRKVVLMTPPPYDNDSYINYCTQQGRHIPCKDNGTVFSYVSACCDIGKKHSVDVVNLYSEMMKCENWPKFLSDGLHFSYDGSLKVSELLWPCIAKRIKLNKIFTPWDEVDREHPEITLLK